ncbi:MAG: hypothetical protein WC886_06905, partial [Saccharofermentanaceae bacterium]
VIPKPKYQIHCIDNLLTLCWKCNFKKGTSILSNKELKEIYSYINKANNQFSLIDKIEMNAILYEYFSKGKDKHGRKNKIIRKRPSLIKFEEFMKLHGK